MANLVDISRGEKLTIAKSIHQNLLRRAAKGPPEPALDRFIKEVAHVGARLDAHVTIKPLADEARIAFLEKLSRADVQVNAWVRRIVAFIEGSIRRSGGEASHAARAVLADAFPARLQVVDDHAAGHNVYCRAALVALRAPAHQPALAAMGMPPAWVNGLEAALKNSDAIAEELVKAQRGEGADVGMAREVEAIWVDCMVRLRHHLNHRAKGGDAAKQIEGEQLIEPLLVALQRRDAEAAARAARKAKVVIEARALESSSAGFSAMLA